MLLPGGTVLVRRKPSGKQRPLSASSFIEEHSLEPIDRFYPATSSAKLVGSEANRATEWTDTEPKISLDVPDSTNYGKYLPKVHSAQSRAASAGLPRPSRQRTRERTHMMTLEKLYTIQQEDSLEPTAPLSPVFFNSQDSNQ